MLNKMSKANKMVLVILTLFLLLSVCWIVKIILERDSLILELAVRDRNEISDITRLDSYDGKKLNGTFVLAAMELFKDRGITVLVKNKQVSYLEGLNSLEYNGCSGFYLNYYDKLATTNSELKVFDSNQLVIIDGTNRYRYEGLVNEDIYLEYDKESFMEYIDSKGKFVSNLILDSDDKIIGIIFTEVSVEDVLSKERDYLEKGLSSVHNLNDYVNVIN